MTQKNEIVQKQKSIKSLLNRPDIQDAISGVMVANMDPQKITRVALLTINKVPKIAECTIPSLIQCIMDCARMGLEPDGRNAHLIPYGNTCTLILDWKGICKLARDSGEIQNVYAELVYSNDEFRIVRGTNPNIHHVPAITNRGELLGAYACVMYNNGSFDSEWMNVEEINEIRNGSRAGKSGPWVTHYGEMAKKTVFRRLSKRMPLGKPEQQRTIEKVVDRETGYHNTEDTLTMDVDAEDVEPSTTTQNEQKPTQEATETETPTDTPESPSVRDNLIELVKQAANANPGGWKNAKQEYEIDMRKADPFSDMSEDSLKSLLTAIKEM